MTELLYTPENEAALTRLAPRFIREDRNGYALTCAIMHMVFAFTRAVQKALIERTDVERMSEEALDERAYSLGMAWYDYGAEEEKKRMWIREAEQMRKRIGTAAAITQLLGGVYATSKVEEWTQYDGEPYHFRVMVFGKADPETEKWAKAAIESTKNLRSILDGFYYSDTESKLILRGSDRQSEEPYAVAQEDGFTVEDAND